MARPGKRWKWLAFGAVVAACSSAAAGYLIIRAPEPIRAEEPPPKGVSAVARVEVTRARQGEMDRTTTQPGTFQAFESVEIYAGVSGYLKTLAVDIGDRIKRGQTLAIVDVPELEKEVQRRAAALDQAGARVAQMEAHVVSAKADLEAARSAVPQAEATAKSKAAELRFREKQLRRMKDLFATKSIDERLVDETMERQDAAREAQIAAEEGVVSAKAKVASEAARIQAAEADVDEARAEVKVAQAELERAQVFVRFATITAPFDGIVTHRGIFPGDYVKAASEGAHAPLLTVQRTDKLRVVVQVPDRDVPFCDPGDPATVEIDALPGEKFPAKVARVGRSEDPETRLMHVEIDLPNPTGKICHGMYGRVTILLQKSNLVTLPASCVLNKTQDGKGKVFAVRDGHAHLVPVVIGSDNGLQIGMVSGVTERDQIVLHPTGDLSEGSPVEVAK
jgi:RND family efflux transporter MFP subunit